MHIVSQKQEEIQTLKYRLTELEKLTQAEKQAQELANQLIQTLKEENLELKNRIHEVHQTKLHIQEIVGLKVEFQSLIKKNQELQQRRTNLADQVIQVKYECERMNQLRNGDLSRTKWDQNSENSRASSNNDYRNISSSYVAPNLIQSRYLAVREEPAHAQPEITRPSRVASRSYLRRVI